MRVKKAQSVVEYALLVALVIVALIIGANFGKGVFNDHFKKASSGYFVSGGIPPGSK